MARHRLVLSRKAQTSDLLLVSDLLPCFQASNFIEREQISAQSQGGALSYSVTRCEKDQRIMTTEACAVIDVNQAKIVQYTQGLKCQPGQISQRDKSFQDSMPTSTYRSPANRLPPFFKLFFFFHDGRLSSCTVHCRFDLCSGLYQSN